MGKKKDLMKEINKYIKVQNNKLDADGVELFEKTLIFAPNQRITAKQMLCDQWFDEIREEMIGLYGNVYPHCGSKEYQLQRFRNKQQDDMKMNVEDDSSEHDEDEEITQNAEEWI